MSFSRGSGLPLKSSDPSRMENWDCNFAPHCSWDLLGRLQKRACRFVDPYSLAALETFSFLVILDSAIIIHRLRIIFR